MKNKHTPDIRFVGFTEDWEQRKLGDVTNYTKGFAFKSTDYKETGVRIIRVSDLSKDDIKDNVDNIFIDFDECHYYEKYKINHEDIIITTVGSKAEMKESAVGRPIIIKGTNNYLLNQNLVKINPKNEYESYFIYCQLLQPNYSNYLAMIERGNANQANIAINDLWEYVLPVPSKEEQTKIGNFFKQLDETITLHQRKLELLKDTKKSLLQKMFPKDGANVPEIRFPGFTDAWEQRKLGEIATLSSSKRVHLSDYVTNGIPFYRGSEISTGGITGRQELFISENLYQEIKGKYGVPQENDLLVTAVGTIGNIWKVDKRKFYYKDGNLIQISKLKSNPDYILSYFNDGIGKRRMLDSAAGSNQKALTMVKMREITIPLPKEDEQIQIGMFFKNLDHLITLHQRELDALKETKKAFLQKMFVYVI